VSVIEQIGGVSWGRERRPEAVAGGRAGFDAICRSG
jgi:hypothetical protein